MTYTLVSVIWFVTKDIGLYLGQRPKRLQSVCWCSNTRQCWNIIIISTSLRQIGLECKREKNTQKQACGVGVSLLKETPTPGSGPYLFDLDLCALVLLQFILQLKLCLYTIVHFIRRI